MEGRMDGRVNEFTLFVADGIPRLATRSHPSNPERLLTGQTTYSTWDYVSYSTNCVIATYT